MSEDVSLDAIRVARIVIGGDVVPTASNVKDFLSGDASCLVDDGLHGVLEAADLRIFNLETPLADEKTPIDKRGPALISPTGAVRGLTALGVDAVALANNHIMDQGRIGLSSTLDALDGAGISYFGAGKNLREARSPLVAEVAGRRVGVYACAEHEFSIAENSAPGANPFDSLVFSGHVAELRQGCDAVVVLYHGGKEHYRYPSPLLRTRCRALVDAGADVVVCQHSHCVGCEERWRGGVIVYGQGNFLFDHQDNEFWGTGILIELLVEDDVEVIYHPIVKNGASVRLAGEDEACGVMEGFLDRSRRIETPGFVEDEYRRLARASLGGYLSSITPGARSLPFRVLNWLLRGSLAERLYGREALLALQNCVECEAHNELLIEGIMARLEDINDCSQ